MIVPTASIWDENPFLFENGMNLSRATATLKTHVPEAGSASDVFVKPNRLTALCWGAFAWWKVPRSAPTPFENSYSELLIMQHDVQQ
jgi:hypothetical protein